MLSRTYIFCKANVLLYKHENSRLFYNISVNKSFMKKSLITSKLYHFDFFNQDFDRENSGPTFLYICLTQMSIWSPANECQYIHFDGNL